MRNYAGLVVLLGVAFDSLVKDIVSIISAIPSTNNNTPVGMKFDGRTHVSIHKALGFITMM